MISYKSLLGIPISWSGFPASKSIIFVMVLLISKVASADAGFRKGNIRYDEITDMPNALYEVNFTASNSQNTPEQSAEEFLKAYVRILKLDEEEMSHPSTELLTKQSENDDKQFPFKTLMHKMSRTTPAGTTVRYQQIYSNIPVYDAEIAVTLDQNQTVTFVMSSYRKVSPQPMPRSYSNQISKARLAPIVENILKEKNKSMKKKDNDDISLESMDAKLVIYHQDNNSMHSKVAWLVTTDWKSDLHDVELVIDAVTGILLAFNDGDERNKSYENSFRGSDATMKSHDVQHRNIAQFQGLRGSSKKDTHTKEANNKEARYLGIDTSYNSTSSFDSNDMFHEISQSSSSSLLIPSPAHKMATIAPSLFPSTPPSTLPSTLAPSTPPSMSPSSYHQSPKALGNVFNPDPISTSQKNYKAGNINSLVADNNDKDSEMLTNQLKTVILRDIQYEDGLYTLRGPWASIVDTERPFRGYFRQHTPYFNFTRSQSGFEAVNCYYHIDNMMRYVNNELGIELRPTKYKGGVRYDPHGLGGRDYSHYARHRQELAFGIGGVDDGEDAHVIIHELTHGFHDWLTGGSISKINGLSEVSLIQNLFLNHTLIYDSFD